MDNEMTMPTVTAADEIAWFRRALGLPKDATFLDCVKSIRELQLSRVPANQEMTEKFNVRIHGPDHPPLGEIAGDIAEVCGLYVQILSKDRYEIKTESDVEKLLTEFRTLQGRIEEVATVLKATDRYIVGVGLGFKNA